MTNLINSAHVTMANFTVKLVSSSSLQIKESQNIKKNYCSANVVAIRCRAQSFFICN